MKKMFVDEGSVVKKIWNKADNVLFIFAGAAAEFALNKAVDWLYFTGQLPADPLGRLFSTVVYAQHIIFSDEAAALQAIDNITAIHRAVEKDRGDTIPDWAYRDVLFLLIDYSIRSFELLERKLNTGEKEDIFDVFFRVALRMQIPALPQSYAQWRIMRAEYLEDHLVYSDLTGDLYRQYKKHLGPFRYALLKQVQLALVPERVKLLLSLGNRKWLNPVLRIYKFTAAMKLNRIIKKLLLPGQYRQQIERIELVKV